MGQDTVLATVKRFKNALESINIRVDQLILFGSHAEGTAREDSDIDLVVISSSFSDKSYWERINILTDAIYQVFAPIEASAFTPDEWKSKKSLISDYAKNGVLV
ncbi:MAG: nucleotidyltransferase domain-containing protein [Deltaproteobacteria bacterium]|jgi:predicted nucleotidyltransferase|nr:nucleotidyltransferase domain-containing protein [Deltaproteobacteria bacterium]